MALTINTYHGSYNRTKRSGGLGAIKNFVIHNTGGTGSAKNNCMYFARANRKASADWFVDKNGDIWEYNNILDGWYTWAVGDGRGKYGITNTNSVHVEVVSDGDAFTAEQIVSLIALYNHVCSILGRKLKVVRHYDASRKHCPAYYVDQGRWNGLYAQVTGGKAPAITTAAPKPASSGSWDNKAWLKNLQLECNRQGFSNQTVDGIFGKNTLAGCPTLRKGARGNITKLMQQKLAHLGYDTNGIDGIFGNGTLAAVKKFQKHRGLAVDGVVGKNTWTALCNM